MTSQRSEKKTESLDTVVPDLIATEMLRFSFRIIKK